MVVCKYELYFTDIQTTMGAVVSLSGIERKLKRPFGFASVTFKKLALNPEHCLHMKADRKEHVARASNSTFFLLQRNNGVKPA